MQKLFLSSFFPVKAGEPGFSLSGPLRGLGYGGDRYTDRRISRSTPHADSACRLSNDTPLTHSMRRVAHPLRSELDRRV